MKKFTILTLAIAMVAISVSAADDAKPKRPKQAPPSAELLKKYDKNNDGKINKDDSLSKEDMAAYRAEMKKAREAAAGGKDAPAPAPAK
ncbi:MAG TPA: hypothetical protein VK530_07250 [Candidatus Acidoferrum sp.]|nr:hypothetical protein [Candidatus Acidoferrum sp.]